MPDSNPSATTISPPPGIQQLSGLQQLAGLLGNLMPLLLRFQSQAFLQPQAFQPQGLAQQIFQPQGFDQPFFDQPFQGGPGNFTIPNPALDRQAAENFIADIIAEQLRSLSTYLEANAAQYAGLESAVPIVTQAAHRFAARDFAQAFNLIWLAHRTIEAIRAADPKVPPPRAASSDQTSSSIH
jgi:hypothetical protein